MANAAQNATKFKIGKLSPEESERLASTFRPAWELDDAPFTPAHSNALSPAEVDALAGGAGVSPSVRGTLDQSYSAPPEPKTEIQAPRAPVHEPKVEIAGVCEEPQQHVAEVRAQQVAPTVARRPYTPPRPPPKSVNMRDADRSDAYVPVKKSNMGLILGAVAVLVVGGGIFGVRSLMSSDKPTANPATPATTSAPTHEEAHIPPPPEATQIAAQPPVQTAPAQTAKPITVIDTTGPVHATAAVTPPVHTAAAAHPAGGATHAAATAHTAGHTAIVRDNPF